MNHTITNSTNAPENWDTSAKAPFTDAAIPSATLHVTPTAIAAVEPTHVAKRKAPPTTPPSMPFGNNNFHPRAKRQRRAPSSSQWIPPSLQGFNLCPIECTHAAALPLPPVFPCADIGASEWAEERNSLAEGVAVTPYHPNEWTGSFPGPAPEAIRKSLKDGLTGGDGWVMGRLN
ncbi:hypothetical protein FIBSPDRAFT_126566 [Athelia psychrophila]|uniref:Uncharacterized protein n=1 Tax=Athelia psychrophila TaxID=1759441 RepID=A0A166T7V2_9AGAM|nr:hypothetical protein FIBSPDRAFT_126566 [Fibularhizoctonia sp. CBS 109695]